VFADELSDALHRRSIIFEIKVKYRAMFNRVPHPEDVKDSASIALSIHNFSTRRGDQLRAASSVVLTKNFPIAY